VPIDAAELRRGRICLALFPFAPSFPATLPDGVVCRTIEDWARQFRGRPAGIVSEARLRPVLLLHDRTRAGHGDVLCLRINSVKPENRAIPEVWAKIERHEHPFFFHLSREIGRYQLREDSIIALSSLGSVHRSAILAWTGGELSHHEMQVVSERLARIIELDLSAKIADQAKALLRLGGHTKAP